MSPSILQLQALGVQDVYLTKDPQINVFKYNYYRYINFATDTVNVQLNNQATFGQKISCTIPKRGHLLSKLFLHIKLPPLTKNGGTYASWCDTLGYAIFKDPIEFQINGVTVDRLYPQFMNVWDDLTNKNKQLGKNLMILKSDTYASNYYNAEKEVDLVIPLEFWFTKQYNMSLPLLSMYNQEIKINFSLKNFSECVNYDGLEPDFVSSIESSLFAEYIFLDDIVLKQFQEQKHTFVIDQIQYNGDELIPANTILYNSSLKFNHPCKEIVFFCVERENISTNNYFSYSKTPSDTPLVKRASLLLDGRTRFDSLPEFYYRTIFPHSVHSVIPMRYIYTMPFSTNPEDNQPTGSINLSRFNDVTLSLNMHTGNTDCYLYTFAISYNIVIIENGNLTMEFSYF